MQIRSLSAFEEYEKCVELQHQVWGFNDRDLLPARYMKVTHMHGGSVLGAFEGERLIGFAFAQPALHGKQVALYSNILAVHPDYRNRGIGTQLKLGQRREALDRGILLLTWAFDPLQARNAYLNLNKLGAVVCRYMRDIYGSASSSSLHSGLGTDRVLAEWWLGSARVQAALQSGNSTAGKGVEPREALPPTVLFLQEDTPDRQPRLEVHPIPSVTRVALEVPARLDYLMEANMELARRWRDVSRELLIDLFARGYRLVHLARVAGSGNGGKSSFRTFYIGEACENRTD